MDNDNFLFKALKKLVNETDRVDMDTQYCAKWRACHENCKGCESEIGCRKLRDIMDVLNLGGLLAFIGSSLFSKDKENPKPNMDLLTSLGKTANKKIREIIEDKNGVYRSRFPDEKLAAQIDNIKTKSKDDKKNT